MNSLPPSPIPAVLILATAFTLGSCRVDNSSSTRAVREEIDGVEFVSSQGSDVELAWPFEQVASIHSEMDGELLFSSLKPWTVAADSSGRVYILDEDAKRIRVFDTQGRLARSFGRAGEGPGELAQPAALTVSSGGQVGVYDYGRGGVSLWLDSARTEFVHLSTHFWGPSIARLSGGYLYNSVAAEEAESRTVHLVLDTPDGPHVLAERNQEIASGTFPSCGFGGLPVTPIFDPELEWASYGSTVAVAAAVEYEISVYLNGTLEQVLSRDVEPRAATRELAVREVADGIEFTFPQRCVAPAEEVVEARGYRSSIPAITGLALAPDGSIWVRRGTVTGDAVLIDVFGPEGAYEGTLPAGSPFPVAFAGRGSDSRLVSIHERYTGEQELEVIVIRGSASD